MMTFRKTFLLVLTAWAIANNPAIAAMGDATQTLCADGTHALCSTLPTDMANHPPLIGYIPNSNAGGGSAFNQTFVDYFGWQSFVALNWPLDANGNPSTTKTIVTDTASPRVWSTYPTKEEVFGTQVKGVENSSCANNAEPGKLKIFRTSKFELTSFVEAFTPYPLIDRYGNFVLYDVRLNETEVNYLQKNNLTTEQGQKAFGKPYDFPAGSGAKVGAIEIKSAWRIMTNKDPADSFYTTEATIVVPAQFTESGQEMCIDATVGLVGMHIMQKFTNPTDFSDFWAWSTFEHVNNAPLANNAPVSQINAASPLTTLAPPACSLVPNPLDTTKYSFYNVSCNSGLAPCALNTPPQATNDVFKWAAQQPYASNYLTQGMGGPFGTQVARCFDIYDSAQAVTNAYHSQFGNSIWKNYMLIGVQWGAAGNTGSGPFAALKPFPAPIYLTNTAIETYLQTGPVEKPKSGSGSCITCHNLARDKAGNNANFSFLPAAAE